MSISETSPSNKLVSAKSLLNDFLWGSASLSTVTRELSFAIDIDFQHAPDERSILRNDLQGTIAIEVQEEALLKMINRYLNGTVTEQQLSDWAAFIYMSGLYVPEGDTEEERWEAGDNEIWDIIQRLVTPSLFGGLDSRIASHYIDMLEEN